MKKFAFLLLVFSLLLCLPLAVQATEEGHNHCVCGGAAESVGDHTQCEAVEWLPLSRAMEDLGCTMETADFGLLPDGYYYLDADVTVTGTSGIGKMPDELATAPSEVSNIAICLNGHSITTQKAEARVFGYVFIDSSLSICDCSYNGVGFSGSVSGTDRAYGGVIYTSAGSVLNIYGGNFVGTATAGGGALAIGCDDGGDLDGDGVYDTQKDTLLAEPSCLNVYNGKIVGCSVTGNGGAVQLFHKANMNLYGGTVVGGSAKHGGAISVSKGILRISGGTVIGGTAEAGGALYCGGTCYITGGTVDGGLVGEAREVCQVIGADGQLIATYTDFAEGLAAVKDQNDRYLKLIANVTSDAVAEGRVYVDLAGHTLQGITITGEFYGLDSATDGYVGSRAGTLRPASGTPVRQHKANASQVGETRRYLAVESGGAWSFHRFYMGVTKLSLKTNTEGVGVGYRAVFSGSTAVARQLAEEEAYGYKLWVSEDTVITKALGKAEFAGRTDLTLRVENFLSPLKTSEENRNNAQLPVYASVFIKLADGTVIENDPVVYTFQDMIELADPNFDSYTQAQQSALTKMSADYGLAMVGWDVPHIHHAKGGLWTTKTEAQFLRGLKDVGSSYYYRLPAGNYVLTEDVDLSKKPKDGKDMGLRIYEGDVVRICLNGHTLSCGNARMFRIYGQLDICDCQPDEHEGDVISHRNVDGVEEKEYGAIFYAFYNSQVNLYGGNMKATGTVNNGGIGVIAHDGDMDDPDQKPAVMNIYGGSVSGGTTLGNGGLLWIIHGGDLNMYGGTLSGGISGGKGGAICATAEGSAVNLRGGTITGNTAVRGGGVRMGEQTELTLAGDIVIENNTATEKDSNLSVLNNNTLDFEGLQPGSRVYLASDIYRVLGSNPQLADSVIPENTDHTVRSIFGRMTLVSKEMRTVSAGSGFQVGYGQVLINPKVIEGMPLSGYSTGATRRATAQDPDDWDDLYAQAIAVTDEKGETILIITLDLIRCKAHYMDEVLEAVYAATNVPKGNIFVTCSHNHSSPETNMYTDPAVEAYLADLSNWVADAAYAALADRAPATMDVGSFDVMATVNGKEKRMNFTRHYSYTDADGVLQYFGDNFGTATYNSTTQQIWEADPTMHLVRFNRDGKDILISNWRAHPHQTGGSDARKLSADVVGTFRYYMNQLVPDAHFMYIQGAAGDVNTKSRLSAINHGITSYITYGKTLAQVVVDNLDCLQATETGDVRVDNYVYTAITDKPSEEEYLKAKEWKQMILDEEASREPDLMPMSEKAQMARDLSKGTYDYASYYELANVISRYDRKDTYEMPLNAFAIGDHLGFFTAPAELWDTVSIEIEETSPFDTTICVGYSMDYHSYYPYYPGSEWSDVGAPYESYESECRHYVTPATILDMIAYWKSALQRIHG